MAVKPERWQRVKELFEAALERRAEQRTAFLKEACGGDESLREEVEGLILSYEQGESFLERPAVAGAAHSLLEDQTATLIGRSIGPYRIIREIGRGGMGEVYLAEDSRLGRSVALKLLPAIFTKDQDRLSRFKQEARVASCLSHPNVCVIHGVGETEDGRHYIVMEYVEGQTLSQHMVRARMKLGEVVDVAAQIASALTAAHAAGIMHRDIKPENIMLRQDGIIKVLDFGLAKLTQREAVDLEASTRELVQTESGMVQGTIRYMSPEQARGLAVDARTDIWSLGVVLYHMIAGRVPFEGATTSDVLAAILEREPISLTRHSPEVPAELERIITKALRKDRDERYQTVKDLMIDLKSLRDELAFEAKLGRTASPKSANRSGVKTAGGTTVATALQAKAQSDDLTAAKTESNAEYIVERHKRAAIIALTVLALATAGVVYFAHFAPRGQAIRSLAVLPFANGSGDPDLEYLSDGLSESLIDRLSQLPGVKVIARSSSFKYKGREVDPREAAQALGVEGLVMGRVVQRGDDLQVRAELVDTRDGTQVWGEQYSRRTADIQAVQEEISRTISERLRLRLTGAQEQQLKKPATQNLRAYQFYLNGLFYLRKGGFENMRRALDYYNQAVALDPDFALAWAGVASAYFGLAGNSLLDPKDALPKAKAAAHRALELDEAMAEAHSLLAGIKQDEWDWAGAERGHKRAVELNPNLAEARHRYARYLSVTGRLAEALAEVKRAQELDPLRTSLRLREGIVLYLARCYDEAIEKLQNVIELEPDHGLAHAFLGYAYDAKGMYEQAISEYQKVISIEREMTNAQIFLGHALAQSGKRSEARAILDKLRSTKEYVSPAELAVLYIGLGDKEGAIASLERAYAAHDLQMQYLKVVPHFDGLRSDPRFQDLMRKVGLPQ